MTSSCFIIAKPAHLKAFVAQELLPQLLDTTHPAQPHQRFHVDAWFLDGFAPAKNPELWHADVFTTMAQLSTIGTTVTTFTAAGAVKRGLEEAGFSVIKVKWKIS